MGSSLVFRLYSLRVFSKMTVKLEHEVDDVGGLEDGPMAGAGD